MYYFHNAACKTICAQEKGGGSDTEVDFCVDDPNFLAAIGRIKGDGRVSDQLKFTEDIHALQKMNPFCFVIFTHTTTNSLMGLIPTACRK